MLIISSLPALAVNRNWTGAAGTSDWFNSGNWSGTPAGVPGAGDSPRLGVATTPVPALWPDYNGDNSANPPSLAFTVGQGISASFTMSGGTYVQSAGNITIGNGGTGISGAWTHNGGTFTATASSLNVGLAVNSTGNVTLNSGSITVGTMTLGNGGTSSATFAQNGGSITVAALNVGVGAGANATMTLDEGLFYVNGTAVLNNSSKTASSASILVADGATLNANKIDFNKGIMTIESGGLVRIRSVAQTVPLSIRSDNIIKFAGGDMYVGLDYTGTGTIEGWVDLGRMISVDPGKPVIAYNWDPTSGFTHIYTIVPEPTSFALFGVGLGLFTIRRRS